MKILYVYGAPPYKKNLFEESARNLSSFYGITPLPYRDYLGITEKWPPLHIFKKYKERDSKLFEFYDYVRDLAESHDVLVFTYIYEHIFHPDFLESLKNIYKVMVSSDDPEGSWFCSKPFVRHYDHSFCWGVNYDEKTKIWDKFIEWGAKRAEWGPPGVMEKIPDLNDADFTSQKRDIDLVFVGSPSNKVKRLLSLKKKFGKKMKIYGKDWNWKIYLRNFALVGVPYLPMDKLFEIYRRAKIGVNIHMSFGPSNIRLYQLPANGVMQICDCPEGLDTVFDVKKEVVPYSSMSEAVQLIEYYLSHDEERIAIAKAGYKRVLNDYTEVATFREKINLIKLGMLADGITHYKDGTKIVPG